MVATERTKSSGVNFVDITVVLLLAMLWFFVVQVSPTPIVIAMSGVIWFLLTIMVVSRFTGFLSYLKLTKPTWTISYFISIPIWQIVFAFLPQEKLSSAVSNEGSTAIIGKIVPEYIFNWGVNSFMFAFTESLLIVFLVSFFIGVAINKSRLAGQNKSGQIYAILLVAGFASLLHTAVAISLKEAGTFSITVVLVHQLVAFFIMIIMGMFFGAPAIISSHIAKNDLVNAIGGLMWISIIFCIIMDVVSMIVSPREKNTLISKERNFT